MIRLSEFLILLALLQALPAFASEPDNNPVQKQASEEASTQLSKEDQDVIAQLELLEMLELLENLDTVTAMEDAQ